MNNVITIFGSSRPVKGDEEYQLAYEVGKQLSLAGFTVCNGGFGGIMEASARGAKMQAVRPSESLLISKDVRQILGLMKIFMSRR